MGELVGKVLEANIPKFAQQVDLKLPEIKIIRHQLDGF